MGENIRRRSVYALPRRPEIASLEYHAPFRSYVVTVSGMPVQNVVSYDTGQPLSLPCLLNVSPLSLVLLRIPSLGENPQNKLSLQTRELVQILGRVWL